MKNFSKFTIKDILFSVPNLMFRGGLKKQRAIEKSVVRNCKSGIVKMSDFKIPYLFFKAYSYDAKIKRGWEQKHSKYFLMRTSSNYNRRGKCQRCKLYILTFVFCYINLKYNNYSKLYRKKSNNMLKSIVQN